MTAVEWDVFSLAPGGSADPPTYLATLYEAREKSIRVELDGTGSGSFAINHTSPECTEMVLAQGNLVKVRIPEIHSDYIFGFFLETGDFTLISSDEAGGEMLHFGGRGNLSYLEYAVAWSESFLPAGHDPIDGVWRAYAFGGGNEPGAILWRTVTEFTEATRPQHPVALLTFDFDDNLDTDGNAWTDTDATAEFSYQVGDDGLAILLRLLDAGHVLTVQMDPDFTLHGYNDYGRDLTGDAFGTGVVRFERGVNIAIELRRELQPNLVKTHELVAGETNHYGTAALSDQASRVTKEAYLAAFGTSATALNGMGSADLLDRLRQSDTITFPIANRRTADIVLVDPVSIGSPLGLVATDGFYLPGPPTSDNGDFWVGDRVTVHTGFGSFDFPELEFRVMAITITRDDDNHELVVIPELKLDLLPTAIPPNAYMCGAYTAAPSERTTPQQIFWTTIGSENCIAPALAGQIAMIGTTPAYEGWEFLVNMTEVTFHAQSRSVPAGLTLMSAVLNGDLSTGTVVASAYKAAGTDLMTINGTIPVITAGDKLTFWFTPPAGLSRGVLNNANVTPTYITGGLV